MSNQSYPEDFYTKDGFVVQTRSKLTLGVEHMTWPFYSIYDVINTPTNQH